MIHEENWEQIARYLANELSETERAEFERWVSADPERRREVRTLKELMNRVDQEAQSASARESWELLAAKLDQSEYSGRHQRGDIGISRSHIVGKKAPGNKRKRPKKAKRDPVRTWMLGAAAAIVLSLVMVLSTQQGFLDSENTTQELQVEVVSAASGERLTFTLVDGTRVMLHAGSNLEIPTDYGASDRSVTLSGEAYFEVEHDPQRPFTVYTSGSFTRVLGTAFVVRAWSEERQEVIVAEGEVAFGERQYEHASRQRAHLTQNQRAVLSPQSGITMHVVDDMRWYTGWTEGRFGFQARPLAEVVDKLNLWYGGTIRLDEEHLGDTAITADIDYSLPLQTVLEGIAMTMELTLLRSGEAYVLASRNGTNTNAAGSNAVLQEQQ